MNNNIGSNADFYVYRDYSNFVFMSPEQVFLDQDDRGFPLSDSDDNSINEIVLRHTEIEDEDNEVDLQCNGSLSSAEMSVGLQVEYLRHKIEQKMENKKEDNQTNCNDKDSLQIIINNQEVNCNNNCVTDDQIKRILSYGQRENYLDFKLFESHIPAFDQYVKNYYGSTPPLINDDLAPIVIDVDTFFKEPEERSFSELIGMRKTMGEYRLLQPQFDMFIKYLVMKDEIVGYFRDNRGYHLFLTQPSESAIQRLNVPFITKQHLLEIDKNSQKMDVVLTKK